MPPPVVPAVATIITGTTPPARSRAMARASAAGSMPAGAVGLDQPQRGAADAGLVRDLEPGEVALARGVERRGAPGEGARAVVREPRVRAASARRSARCSWPPSRRS